MRAQPAPKADHDLDEEVVPPIRITSPERVADVRALSDWRLWVRFIDGLEGTVAMRDLVHSPGAGVFANLRDPAAFGRVFLDLGAVTWPGDIDIAPDAMHDEIAAKGEWVLG